MNKNFCYLVVSADAFELPFGVFDSLRECSRFLCVSITHVCRAISNHCIVNKKYLVYRVYA